MNQEAPCPATMQPFTRVQRLVVLLLFVALAVKLVHAAWVLSPAFDEYKHAMTGYAYLASGVCCWGLSDTALVGLSGLPFVLRGIAPVPRPTAGLEFQEGEPGDLRPPVHRNITYARLPSVALCLVLGYLVMRLAHVLGGRHAGLLALLLFVASPNIAAHGCLVSTDFHGTFGIFFATCVFYRCARSGMMLKGGAIAALAFAVAQISKYTALVLLAVFPIVAWLSAARRSGSRLWALAWTAGVVALGFVVVLGVYEVPRWVGGLGIPLPVPPEEWTLPGGARQPTGYVGGMVLPKAMAAHGVPGYFHGEFGTTWLSFYPVVIALKTPIGLLILAAIGSIALFTLRVGWAARAALLGPPLLVFLPSCLSKVTYALRYVLPLWPFMIVVAGLAAAAPWMQRRVPRGLTGVLAIWALLSGLRAHPYELSYVNELVGGPRQALAWFADSSLDWGQGLAALAREVRERNIERLHLSYHGSIAPDRYHIPWEPLDPDREVTGWVAISATHLIGLYYPRPPDSRPEAFAWLRGREPLAVVGGSIFLYRIDAGG
ncbi:MAG: glycosyltransferase family 39 protein [Planctomycetota bacterium]